MAQASEPKNYTIDGSHSNVGFTTRHLFSRVNGEFNDIDGQFTFSLDDLKAANVVASVKVVSINTKDKKRDQHLKSDDFFGAGKFPTIQFKSAELTSHGDHKYKMAGELTMHGVTKPVVFDVDFLGESDDPWGGHRASFTAVTKLNRKDFGMNWNKTLDKGGVLVGDEVEVNINIEGLQVKSGEKTKKM
jgi:polyisoprenoid-binding protein YceI